MHQYILILRQQAHPIHLSIYGVLVRWGNILASLISILGRHRA